MPGIADPQSRAKWQGPGEIAADEGIDADLPAWHSCSVVFGQGKLLVLKAVAIGGPAEVK
jgi:hypothetical protein